MEKVFPVIYKDEIKRDEKEEKKAFLKEWKKRTTKEINKNNKNKTI